MLRTVTDIEIHFRPWAMDSTNPTLDFEAPKDPGAHKAHTNLTDNEILGKFVGS